MYKNAADILKATEEKNIRICDLAVENEIQITGKSHEKIIEKMKGILKVMRESAEYANGREIVSVSGLLKGNGKKAFAYSEKPGSICGETINKAMARALSCSEVNASMGRIVAAPTAGSCGILPAAIITAGENINATDDQLVDALFTASAVGQIIAHNATLAGAEGGCQAECGAAAAMAAAALVELYGGTPEMAFHAGAIAIKNILGLVCDPVAGLVEVPCAKRNSSGVVNAMASADLALAGIQSMIPFDEVVDAMYKVGKTLPHQLRETALGGLAITPTAIKFHDQIFKK